MIKALYMDDLYDWSWFRGTSLFDFAFKFYESTKYRPVFETIQYIIYMIVGTNPIRFTIINKIYNAIVAIFIYYFVKSFSKDYIISFLTSITYLISHFAYYQIGQGIGSLETTALLLSLIVLYLCLRLMDDGIYKDINATRNLVLIYIFFFILVFDHERYLSVALPIISSVILSRKINSKRKRVIYLLIFLIEIAVITFIRFAAIGNVIPAGTGGTRVEETFSIKTFVKYFLYQIAIIFGINIGPEHLFGIDFASVDNLPVKYATFISIAIILIVVIVYIISKIKYSLKNDNGGKLAVFYPDIAFLFFIGSVIASTSVTIRIEMRFVYTSFIASVIYFAYMCSFLCRHYNTKTIKIIMILVFIGFFVTRMPVELLYRSYFDKIYCFVDTKRVNSIYDNTIGVYGVDDTLHNKRIYIINKYYGMTNFYAEYLFKIYDKEDIGNKINLVDDISDIDPILIDENSIILNEDIMSNTYVRVDNSSIGR